MQPVHYFHRPKEGDFLLGHEDDPFRLELLQRFADRLLARTGASRQLLLGEANGNSDRTVQRVAFKQTLGRKIKKKPQNSCAHVTYHQILDLFSEVSQAPAQDAHHPSGQRMVCAEKTFKIILPHLEYDAGCEGLRAAFSRLAIDHLRQPEHFPALSEKHDRFLSRGGHTADLDGALEQIEALIPQVFFKEDKSALFERLPDSHGHKCPFFFRHIPKEVLFVKVPIHLSIMVFSQYLTTYGLPQGGVCAVTERPISLVMALCGADGRDSKGDELGKVSVAPVLRKRNDGAGGA